MKEFLQKVMEWYEALASREKYAVLLGAGATIFFLFYIIIWAPVHGMAETARHRFLAQQKLLLWMQAADGELQQAGGTLNQEKLNTPVAMLHFLQGKLAQSGLSGFVKQLNQINDTSIELQLQKVPFDQFMQFMLGMLKLQPLSISQLSATPTDTAGWVDVQMVISLNAQNT